ncbi:MAG: transcription termination factor Rho [Phycisphaerae bacterium]
MANAVQMTTGTFEPAADGGGFLRQQKGNYRPLPSDARVPAALVRRLRLRGGETVAGPCRQGRNRGKRNGVELTDAQTINGLEPEVWGETPRLEEQTAVDPQQAIRFETEGGPLSMRLLDLLTPIGRGQRGLIVSPPRAGKTVLLQEMAAGIATNYPDLHIIVLLVDERPEEVTDMRRKVQGEVIASSNDHDATSHLRVARLAIGKAKRMVECGQDVVVLMDSLTRLGRASNNQARGSGRIMSGGLDTRALEEPKSMFGAARNIENGGSLTIIATTLIETGSRMDEVIFNEFKGTGNMEILLSREMANRRIWPAIDLDQSGTRKEELLLKPDALAASHRIRRDLSGRPAVMAMETLLKLWQAHPDNASFIASVAK